MKNLDVLIVRILPFILYIQMIITLFLAIEGRDDYPFNLLHSNSAIYALALYLISRSNKKYHCSYNRAMYIVLIIVPIFNYIDAKFNLVEDIYYYICIEIAIFLIALIITAYLALRHFIEITKRRHKNYDKGK